MMAGKLAILFALVLCLIAVADARGTLRVDNIVAVEDPVVIDALINEEAEIANTVAADTLGFGNFDTLRLNSPFIDVSASFVDITSSGDFVSQSADGDIGVGARQNVDVNGDRINFTSREGDVRLASDFGELSVIAGQQINASAPTIDVDASAGGIAILSEGHDATFDADNSLFLLSDEATGVINVEASDDLTAAATTQAFLVAGGAVDMDSRAKTIFDATESLNVVSSFGDLIANAGDEVHVTAGDSFSISAISTSISSNTDGVDINGFEGVEIDSSNGRMTLSGLAQGVSFTALDGQVGLTSSDSSIDFSAVGAGDHAAVYVRGDFSSTVTGELSTDARLNTQIYGNTISVATGSTSLDANGDINVVSHNDLQVTSEADLVIEADEVRLLATDIADGETTFSANAEDINFSGDEVFIYGGEFDMRAGDEDFVLNSNEITISALGGDSRSHEISLRGEDVNFTGGDAVVTGGRVHFTGGEQVDMEIGGDAVFNTRQLAGEDSLSIQSGDDINIVSTDGDFSLTDVFGSLEWRFAANPDVASDASVSIAAGNLDITAGEESFRNDVEFNVIALDELSFSSTGGNTASDVEFSAQEVVFTSTETANFGSDTGVSLDSDNDIYFDADNIIVNGNSGNGDVTEFNVGDHLYVVTERNPTTTDSITLSASGTATLDVGDIVASSSGPVTFSGDVSNTIISDDTLTFSSGNGNPITFDVEEFNAMVEDSIILTGLQVTFDAAMDITVATGDDAEFISTKLGFDVDTLSGDLSFTSNGDIDISSENNSILTSTVTPNGPGGNISFMAGDDIQVTSSDDTTITSRSGSVSFSSTASSVTFNGAADMSFSSGTSDDDALILNAAGTLTFDADRTIDIAGDGPLSVDAGGDYTITGADVDFISNGPVTFNGEEQVAITSTGTFDLTGGEILIEATVTDVTFNGGIISIDNEESDVAQEEFLGVVDDLVYTAGGRVVVEADDASYESNDFAFTTVDGGRILLSGDNVLLDTVSDNQDASFTSEAAINFLAETDITYFAAGDFTVDAAEFITINAADVVVVVESDLKIEAEAGQLLVENTGAFIEFIVEENSIDADPVRVTTNLEFRADDELQLFARTGEISFSSAGSSQLRANLDGGRNTQGARQRFAATGDLGSGLDGGVPNYVNQPVGFSVNTRHTEGNIIFQTLEGPITVDSELEQEFIANDVIEIEVTDGTATLEADLIRIEALDGSFSGFSPLGELDITVTDDLDFLASGSMEILSDQLITFEAGEVVITAFGGDARFETFLQNNIAVEAADIEFTSGAKGQTFVAQGDITSTSSSDTTVIGARGVSVTTNAGPISVLSASTGSFFEAEEEIRISSGSDLLLENGAGGEAIRFNGVGVVLSATQGNVNLNADNDVLLDAGTIVLQSLGTSTTSRDRVLFDSNGNLVTFTADNAFFDATELVSIGKTTTPEVTITTTADIDINSSGNIDIVSDDAIVFALSETYTSESENLLSLSAFNEFGITGETGVTLEAIRGSMNLVASADLTLDAEDIRLTSEGSTDIIMTSTDPMTFTITNALEFNSQDVIDVQIGGDALYTAGVDITIQSDTRNGDHDLTFESDGDQIYTIVDAVSFSAESSLLISASGNAVLSSLDFLATTDRDGDLVFNVGDDLALTSPELTASAAIIDLKSSGGPIMFTSITDFMMSSGPAAPLADSVRDGHFVLSSTAGDVTVTAATTIDFSTDELFNIEAEAIEFNAMTDITINTDFLFASHEEDFNEGSMTFSADGGAVLLSAPTGVITYEALDDLLRLQFDVSATLTSADDVNIFSVADREGSIEIDHVVGPFNLDVPGSILFQGGNAAGPGDVIVDVEGAYTALGDFVSFGIAADDDVAPVAFFAEGDITLTGADEVQFIAMSSTGSDRVEDDTGAIDMFAGDGGFIIGATNNMNIQSALAGIKLLTAGDMTFEAPALNITSQGIESGIFLHAREDVISVDSTLLFVEGDEAVSFNSLVGDFLAEGTSEILFSASGPGGEDGAGFKVSHSDSSSALVMTGAATELEATNGDVRLLFSDTVTTDPTTATLTGGTILVNAQGFPQESAIDPDASLLFSGNSVTALILGDLVFDAGTDLAIIALGDSTLTTGADAPIVFRADGDVDFEFTAASSITATDQLLLVSENNGIELAAPNGDQSVTATTSFNVFSGIDEQVNAITFEQSILGDQSLDLEVSVLIDSSNNALFQGNEAMALTSEDDLTFLARKGSQLFRSVTLDTMTGVQPGPFEMQTNADEDILMAAHYFIRHRGHNRLSFFDANTATTHTTESAEQQLTSPNVDVVDNLDNACTCTGNTVGYCSNVACPDTYHKIRDMQIALLELGLLRL